MAVSRLKRLLISLVFGPIAIYAKSRFCSEGSDAPGGTKRRRHALQNKISIAALREIEGTSVDS